MANKRNPFHSQINSQSKRILFRERLILNVANLRYELEMISVLTPLNPGPGPQLAPSSLSKAVRKKTRQSLLVPV